MEVATKLDLVFRRCVFEGIHVPEFPGRGSLVEYFVSVLLILHLLFDADWRFLGSKFKGSGFLQVVVFFGRHILLLLRRQNRDLFHGLELLITRNFHKTWVLILSVLEGRILDIIILKFYVDWCNGRQYYVRIITGNSDLQLLFVGQDEFYVLIAVWRCSVEWYVDIWFSNNLQIFLLLLYGNSISINLLTSLV